ncbi:secretin and TonB N-terminal domain-containing protein [Paraburkholderia sp. ZP32-5]|uniref:secretin and TonB N-terminal domain-containing protein n=1 Tax=Paraburkholderia sp. ZP32-5 TaxID=2883245 RepID=UPI002DD430EA|nr:secretin and TonB N-terminal domain-containing protein [Paraburkholderia sp. ZP32-5]
MALVLCVALGGLSVRAVRAQQTDDGALQQELRLHFDLPAESLELALQAFGRISELAVVAPAPLLAGRTSSAVSGDYSPREALDLVMEGTGLQAEFMGTDEAIIVARPEAVAPAPPAAASAAQAAWPIDGIGDDAGSLAYAGMLQARLTQSLCEQPLTVPGGYRLAAQIRIDDKGTVVAASMVASSGMASRDAMIMRALRSLKLDAPPGDLPEPVTILLRPTGNGVHIQCPQPGGQG